MPRKDSPRWGRPRSWVATLQHRRVYAIQVWKEEQLAVEVVISAIAGSAVPSDEGHDNSFRGRKLGKCLDHTSDRPQVSAIVVFGTSSGHLNEGPRFSIRRDNSGMVSCHPADFICWLHLCCLTSCVVACSALASYSKPNHDTCRPK